MSRGFHRRRFRRGGRANATIDNQLELERGLVAGSTSVTISIGGNVNWTIQNDGSANAVANSRRTDIQNED